MENAIWSNGRSNFASCILAIGTEIIAVLDYFKFGPNYKARIDGKYLPDRDSLGRAEALIYPLSF